MVCLFQENNIYAVDKHFGSSNQHMWLSYLQDNKK